LVEKLQAAGLVDASQRALIDNINTNDITSSGNVPSLGDLPSVASAENFASSDGNFSSQDVTGSLSSFSGGQEEYLSSLAQQIASGGRAPAGMDENSNPPAMGDGGMDSNPPMGGGDSNPNPPTGGGGDPNPNPNPNPPQLAAPVISISAGLGEENQPLALSIGVTVQSGVETHIVISGVPSGAVLSAGTDNGNGTWTLGVDQLAGLTLELLPYQSGTFTLAISAVSSNGTMTAEAHSNLPVVIEGVATAPDLSLGQAAGFEDTAIALNIGAALIDTDGSESLSVTITGVPDAAVLSSGTKNNDGSWTLSVGDLTGLTLTPPEHWSGNFNLTVTATSSENNTTASTIATLGVNVEGVASLPNLFVQQAVGVEDTAIPLVINAVLADTDGSETLGILISGVPAGATLSSGVPGGNGTWTLTPQQLVGLTFTPPAHASGSFTLGISAISSENGTTQIANAALNISVAGSATMPQLQVSAASGNEDTAIPLSINASLVDTDGSETLSVTVSGIPAGGILSAGHDNGNGTWTLTAAQLAGLTFTPPEHAGGLYNLNVTATSSENNTMSSVSAQLSVAVAGVATVPTLNIASAAGIEGVPVALSINAALADTDGSETLGVTISGAPANAVLSAGTKNNDGTWTLTSAQLSGLTLALPEHASGNFNLTVMATSAENGTMASTVATLPVEISGVASVPTLSVQPASGAEDTAISLNITSALVDSDGSETLAIQIFNLPQGAVLSAGVHNNDGSWTLTPAQLPGLTLTPPEHWSGTLNLAVSAVASENNTYAYAAASLVVTVAGVATTPMLSIANASGIEDHVVALNIGASLADTDSETLSVTVSGVPTGAVLSAGINNNGTWTLTSQQLSGLTLTPPEHWSGSLDLHVTATSSENGTFANASADLSVTIAGEATAPIVHTNPANSTEGNNVALDIDASLVDIDGSETLSVIVSGVPQGAVLSAGTQNSNGTWTLQPAQLSGLELIPPSHWSGVFDLTVTAVSAENNTTASTSVTLPVVILGLATPPIISVSSASGQEDDAIALNIGAAPADADSEVISLYVVNVPAGAVLSAGTQNADGSWTLAPEDLAGLTLTPPANWSGAFSLSVTATSAENGSTASSTTLLSVTIAGEADTPMLSVQAASGAEDTAIALNITSALVDTDGSETLSVTISGLPTGATLSAGTNNNDGTWTLSASQLSNLKITPPSHWSGDFTLDITATSSESGTQASVTSQLAVSVVGVATTPVITASPATGNEDSAIALSINAALVDTDGSETLSVTISGLPSGATLSTGTNNNDGTWTLTPQQLSGLTLTPPLHASGNYTLTVTAISSENNTTASSSVLVPVSVTGVATAPHLNVQAAAGNEDSAIGLNINAALEDTDSSESLSIKIENVPAGATLSAGTNIGNGAWTLTPAQLSGLTLTPPEHWSGTINLTVTAGANEIGGVALTRASLPVVVSGVATTPVLNVAGAAGVEDTAIALNINAALADTDGSETLSVTISGVPPGGALSAGTNNGNGTWTLNPAQLSGLTFTPPSHASGNYTLGVTATSSENGTTATASSNLAVAVAGSATTPLLNVANASGSEDTPVALNISTALADTDGSETLSVTITGVPSGATLSAGTHNPDGSWTLTSAQLSNLTLTPPSHWSGHLALDVAATSSENGTTATVHNVLGVDIAGVATMPTLSVSPAQGNEDSAIALDVAAALVDTDGSETLFVTISGVPAGGTLSAGTHNPDGSWTLTSAQLSGLTFTPPSHASGNYTLNITATSSENGTQASASGTLPVLVAGVATTPVVNAVPASGGEDTAIALNISAALADTDGSETLSVIISGVPTGAALSAGTNNGNGTWTLNPAQLSGLTFTPPSHASGNYTLTVTATSSENNSTASASTALPIAVAGVATAPTLSVYAISGSEDAPIALNIAAALVDTDGSETLSVIVSGVPTGATLSAGTNNGNGTWTLTAAQVSNVTLTPPANYSGSFTLGVTATSAENNTTSSVNASLPVTILGMADVPTLSVHPISGNEDTAIALNISAGLADTDGSETLSVMIAGVPAGATLSAGTNNGNGTWTLTPAQLSAVTLTPPANYSGTFTLSVTATSAENNTTASVVATLPVTIIGVADAPTLNVHSVSGNEDAPIALNIAAALVDTDGSETLSVIVSGVPSGATLSAGTNNGNGTWTLTAAQLSNVSIMPPANYSGTFNLGITATSSENGTTANVSASLPVTVLGLADAPVLSVHAVSGAEDTAIALNVSAALADTDGSETLSITIAGMPAGATLSSGTNNGNGSWTLTSAQLSGLTFTPPSHASGTCNLSITATSSENGTTATTNSSLPVTVSGVATMPSLVTQAVSGNEDSAIALNISAALADTDGSETLSVKIAGVPSGATLSAGTYNQDGTWTLTPAQLSGLTLTPLANFSGAFSLTVTAMSVENNTWATNSAPLPVTVRGVADTPTLSVQAASGNEDAQISLNISAALTDTDNSEKLSITITGLPTGALLSAGLYDGNGRWSLTPAQLSGLKITPPHDYSGTMNLTVNAISSENEGSSTKISAPLAVTVLPVADAPTLKVATVTGNEDTQIALNITSALKDTDGSEVLSVTVTGVPTGATLSAGTNNGGGSWTLTSAQLANLKITPPANSDADFTLTVTAKSTDGASTATTSGSLLVNVLGVADTPTVSASNSAVAVNTQAPVTIGGALGVDTDGSESITYLVSGVPDGFSLTAGSNNGNNTWTLTQSQLSGLTMVSPYNFQGRVYMTAQAISHDGDGSTAASTAAAFNVSVGNPLTLTLNLGAGIGLLGIGNSVAAGITTNLGSLLGAGGLVVLEDTSIPLVDA
ncbi:MAG: hypothetical protein V4691_00560, partial [Pseudomonadota bacterium]